MAVWMETVRLSDENPSVLQHNQDAGKPLDSMAELMSLTTLAMGALKQETNRASEMPGQVFNPYFLWHPDTIPDRCQPGTPLERHQH